MKNQKGFTLLEILLATGILATISLTAITILSSQLENRNRIDVRMRASHSVHVAMSQLYEDFRHLYLPGLAKRSSGAQYRFGDLTPHLIWTRLEHYFFIYNHRSLIAGTPESNFAQVRYELEDPPTAAGETSEAQGKNLVRYLDTDLKESIKQTDHAVRQPLVEHVKEFKVGFLWKSSFREDWDSTRSETNNRAPLMVKISLEVIVPRTPDQEQKDAGRTDVAPETMKAETIVYLLAAQEHMREEDKREDIKWLQ